MTTQHTQTIWTQGEDNPLKIYGNYTSIASVDGVHATGARTHEEALANARLIAASPELLYALQDTLEELKHAAHIVNLNAEVIETARAAIAKATQP